MTFEKWKKPQALKSSRFDDVARIVHVSPTASYYVTFELLISRQEYKMNMREFARIVNAGKLVDGKIKGTFFLNPSNLLRLYD